MILKTRLARLESKTAAGQLSLAVRAWLGAALSPIERQQLASEAAQALPPVDRSTMSKEAREWLEA